MTADPSDAFQIIGQLQHENSELRWERWGDIRRKKLLPECIARLRDLADGGESEGLSGRLVRDRARDVYKKLRYECNPAFSKELGLSSGEGLTDDELRCSRLSKQGQVLLKQIMMEKAPANAVDRLFRLADRLERLPGVREAAPQSDANRRNDEESDQTNHSDDFTSVNWFGTRYTFAKGNQAESVRVLWEAWDKGGHSLSQETICKKIDSGAEKRFQLSKVFRHRKPEGGYEQHPALGNMIQKAEKGCYHLVPPGKAKKTL